MQPPAGPHQVFSSVYNRQFAKGLVRHPQKDHLQQLSARRHQAVLQALAAEVPPSSWDSCSKGWVGPIKNQASCGCHDAETEVLTEEGWIKWPDYDWKALLGTMNPVTHQLQFQAPLKKHVYDYSRFLYYSDHVSLNFALTPNHRMYRRKWSEKKRTLSSRYAFDYVCNTGWYCGLPSTTSGWEGTELKRIGIGKRIYDGDDFLALLALIISDGWVSKTEQMKNHVSFCCFRNDRIKMVSELADKLQLRRSPSREGVWGWTDAGLSSWLKSNIFTGNEYYSPYKKVPDLVKVASQRQIEFFLKFFGDQHIEDRGERRFYSTSKRLIDDLQELLLKIGKRSRVSTRPPRETYYAEEDRVIKSDKPSYELNEWSSDLLSLQKNQLRQEYYNGKVYCATVPNGTLVTRRDGKLLISGNSCWDYSGTGTVEIAYNVAGVGGGPDKLILSEQYTLDCGRNGGCGGDDNVTVLEWAKKTGLPLSADYGPYHASAGRCQFKQQQTLYKIDDWGFADSSQGQGVTPAELIKAAIMKYGCVGAAIAADGAFSNYQAGQVFDHTTSQSIDHDIILVGWDDSKGSKGAWKLRNSWGTSWGDGGYCYIGYGVNLVGTEAVWAYVNHQNPPIDWYC